MTANPVIIAGAGISGLLLAQHFRAKGIPFEIYERDTDMTTRGIGWGLTLHWSLPALQSLLPEELYARLPDINIDQPSLKAGKESQFPFFDLSTGELKAATPQVPGSPRVRVARQKLRLLLSTGIDIKWGNGVNDFESTSDQVKVSLQDGTSTVGCLLVGCDSRSSRVRRRVLPDLEPSKIPIRVMGAQFSYSPEQLDMLRNLDPYFLQGTASENDSFMYFSVLDAPGNEGNTSDMFTCQACVSWPFRRNFFQSEEPIEMPETKEEKIKLAKKFASTWAEPFKTFILGIPDSTEFLGLDLTDSPPPIDFRSSGRVVLMGDSIHAMSMYRGEGANHAIVDVLDFAEKVTKVLASAATECELRTALNEYEDAVVKRTRPAVLASRKACLDAHEFGKINAESPLLSKRAMFLDFDQ